MDNLIDNHKTNNDVTLAGPEGEGLHVFALAARQALGQYRIVKPLGAGGMGEVYLVEHGILRTLVPPKVDDGIWNGTKGN